MKGVLHRWLWGLGWFLVIWVTVFLLVFICSLFLIPWETRQGENGGAGMTVWEYMGEHWRGMGFYAAIAALVGTWNGWFPGTTKSRRT